MATSSSSPSAESAWPLPAARPEEVGLSSERLARMRTALELEVAEQRIPGAVVAVARRGRLAVLDAVGKLDPAGSAPMQADAVFSIASMTKLMVSTAIMMLYEEGRLLLTDPAAKYLPELAEMKVAVTSPSGAMTLVAAERPFTIQDLLRHTSGLTYRDRGTSEAHKLYPGSSTTAAVRLTKAEFLEALAKVPLVYQPGTTWEYGFSTDVLGLVVEAVTGKSLGEALRERLWAPLGMRDAGFALSDAQQSRYARAFPNDVLTGQPIAIHHATGKSFKFESGGGGMVATAADYMRFLEMLRRGGELDGQRYLGRKTVDYMTADHLGSHVVNRITTMDAACVGYGFGLGVAVRMQTGVAGLHGSTGDYYWSGAYGTYFWVDPAEELCTVFMAAAPGQIRLRYRQLLRALVLQAITD
ncbi:MAG: serine hydrolase domain-containing protein [Hyphomicrobiaceae bacterium]